jgi:molecular chaperone GrpE
MTEQPRATGPGETGSGPGGSASRERADGTGAERIIIRDKRRIDPTGKGRSGKDEQGDDLVAGAETVEAAQAASSGGAAEAGAAAAAASATAAASSAKTGKRDEAEAGGSDADGSGGSGGSDGSGGSGKPDEPATKAAKPTGDKALGAELESLRSALEERTRDLQRVSAEYANYRKRVDRDRGLAAEQTTGTVLGVLLPVLDDLDRAREHGDLVGPFGSVAEQLVTSLGKFGLTGFGEKGDPFDPTRHEAVAHLTSADVTEPTCIDVMRRGYLLGDRLLRPALVAVADPE